MAMELSRRAVLAGATIAGAMPARLVAAAAPLHAGISAACDAAIAHKGCPGVAVAVSRAGSIEFMRGFGLANIETQTPVSDRSIFRIGSLTKQFTAAAVIKLAAMERLALDAPASHYLPAFASLPAFTLLELLNQTAGLHSDEEGGSSDASPRLSQVDLAATIARQKQVFDFEPGTAWLYSNANYVVAGAVVEQVTGKPLAAALEELIFAPLGLAMTAADNPATIVSNRASGYTPTGTEAAPYENAAYLDVTQAGGAGCMRSSVADLCLWHHLLLGGSLFAQRYIDLMLKPGTLRDGRVSGANRFSADDAHYGDVNYACGLLVSGPSDPNPNILHYGFINGFSAVLQTYLRPRVTFAALCNADPGPDLPFRGIRQAVVAELTATPR